MTTPLMFTKAVRHAVKLKILNTGPSGSGKTLGSLRLAEALAPGKVALLDSENDRSSYYADRIDFDVMSLPDSKPDTYLLGLQAAVEAGYGVVVIDSLSHAWQNVLDRKEAYDRANPRSNSYTNWKLFSAEWDRFIRAILDAPIHVIATARSKQAYEQAEVDGKKKVLKLGLAPTIREGTEYEFALHFDLNEQHSADVKKDNTGKFDDPTKVWDLCNGSVAVPLKAWLAGAVAVAKPTLETAAKIDDAIANLPEGKQIQARKRWASKRDKGVTEEEAQKILRALTPAPTSLDPHASDYATAGKRSDGDPPLPSDEELDAEISHADQ